MEDVMAIGLVLAFPALCVASAVTTFVVGLLITLATRGPKAVSWRRPRECRDFAGWFAFSWDFFGNGGRQAGARLFGLEFAWTGAL